MLTQLAYISKAAPGFSAEDLGAIVACAHRNNPEIGVTGILVMRKNQFLQVLEGEEVAVDVLMRRISKDQRHHDTVVIYRKPIERREFEGWSMGWTDLAPKETTLGRAFDRLAEAGKSLTAASVSDVYFLINGFRKGLWEMR